MRPSNILSGAPFRAAILCMGIFIGILAITGYLLYRLIDTSMYGELEEQIREESILLHEVYERGGQSALVSVIAQLGKPVIAGERIAGLFDERGNKLAGNMQIAPAFVGWQTQTLELVAPRGSGSFHFFAVKLATSTLVVGRSTRFIDAVLKQLLYNFALAGLVVMLATLLIGYLLSRRVFVKLQRLAKILDAVSNGDMQARLPVDAANDQIDRVSRQINAHLDQLSALMSSTQNTVNSIAHDLRAPLNRSYLLIQEALETRGMAAESEELVERAGNELTKVNDIIDTILRIARIEGGGDRQHFAVFSLTELASDLADVFQPVIESAGQQLSRDFSGPPDVLVYGDKKMLSQMLVNLIENAICHCPSDARISLSTGETAEHGGTISISDSGPGIDTDLREKVLEPFFRVDASRSSPGSGLGLTLVKAIAVRHGASLLLEDNRPGLRVTVSFPRIPDGAARLA
jgi:signal transduction histidine kinase